MKARYSIFDNEGRMIEQKVLLDEGTHKLLKSAQAKAGIGRFSMALGAFLRTLLSEGMTEEDAARWMRYGLSDWADDAAKALKPIAPIKPKVSRANAKAGSRSRSSGRKP